MNQHDLAWRQRQYRAQQNFNDRNIDPRLLENFGSWHTPEEDNHDIPPADQIARDIDGNGDFEMTHDGYQPASTALPQDVPELSTPINNEQTSWQYVGSSHRDQMRRPRLVYPTPESSSRSYRRGRNANAFNNNEQNEHTWQVGNPFAVLDQLDTSSTTLGVEAADENGPTGSGYLTPTSQPTQRPLPDAASMQQSPSFGRGMSFHMHGQSSHAYPTNFHGWGQPNVSPAQDIHSWNEGPYSLSNPPRTQLSPPSQGRGSGRPASSRRSGHSSGHLSCSHHGCDMRFDTKSERDHHVRYHGPRTKICQECPKAFHFAKDLRRHRKTHTRERTSFCPFVGCKYHREGFTRKDHRDRHVRTLHKQEEGE